jgi:DNA-binding CsgD family transcriptional regulator
METLTHQDYRSLLDCVGELYEHHDLDSFAERLLTLVQSVIAADYSTFTEINERFQRIGCISNPRGVVPKPTLEQQRRYFGEHPLWLHFTQRRLTSPSTISDYMPRRRYRESAFYREIFRNLGVEFMMASSPLNPRGGILPAVALIRSVGDFSERDRRKLAVLHPHIQRAYKHAESATLLQEQNALLNEALVVTRQAMIILSARGKVLFCTNPARQCLVRYFSSARQNSNRLPEALRHWLRRHELPATKHETIPLPPGPYVIERDGGRLTIQALSGQTAGQRILLMEEQCVTHSARLLQSCLGLTPREAEVLFWVAQGKKNVGIAIILGVSAATIEKHLEHILAKLKVETRTAAAFCAHEVFSHNRGASP